MESGKLYIQLLLLAVLLRYNAEALPDYSEISDHFIGCYNNLTLTYFGKEDSPKTCRDLCLGNDKTFAGIQDVAGEAGATGVSCYCEHSLALYYRLPNQTHCGNNLHIYATCLFGRYYPECRSTCVCPDTSVCHYKHGQCLRYCPTGWKGPRCEQDRDECQSDFTHDCDQRCINTHGSYVCGCRPGYDVNSDGKTCHDKHECDLGTSGCAQLCYNTIGSFMCGCVEGYTLHEDGSSCSSDCPNTNYDLKFNTIQGFYSGCTVMDTLSQVNVHNCKLRACELESNVINFADDACEIQQCDSINDLQLSRARGGWDIYILRDGHATKELTSLAAKETTTRNFPGGAAEQTSDDSFPIWAIGVAAAVGFLLIVGVILAIVCCCRKKKNTAKETRLSSRHKVDENSYVPEVNLRSRGTLPNPLSQGHGNEPDRQNQLNDELSFKTRPLTDNYDKIPVDNLQHQGQMTFFNLGAEKDVRDTYLSPIGNKPSSVYDEIPESSLAQGRAGSPMQELQNARFQHGDAAYQNLASITSPTDSQDPAYDRINAS